MSVSAEAEHIEHAVRRGASGYIVKSVNPVDLPAAIRQAYEGTVYHAIRFAGNDEESSAKAAGLTEREIRILRALSSGLPNRAIAKELWVTEQTVKFHLTNIYRKIGVVNRTEAARYAYQAGLGESANVEAV